MLAVAVTSLGFLIYTYLGYPLLIALLARLFPLRTTIDPSFRPSVTVCIAVYNGASFIEGKVRSLLDQEYPPDKLEILVYSDGSTDETEAMVTAWATREPRVRLLRGERRLGKPTGLNRMREAARGELLLITDARQPLAPGALRAMLDVLGDLGVGCVTGNLVLEGEASSGAYWRYEKFIRRQEARFRSIVGMTGSIGLLRRGDLGPLPADLILDDVWIPMRLRLQGRRIIFADEALAYDSAFDDDREFDRKVRTLAGNYQLFARMPALLSPLHNPSWFETVSHKVLRLLCPWALAALVVGAVGTALVSPAAGLERSAGTALLGCQAAFYLGAFVGPRGGRFCALARTFVVLNFAALVGFWRFLSGRQRVTW